MRINNLFNEKKVVFSLEIFPPKVVSSIDTIYKMLEELRGINPDYISVTYGAGGAATSNRTLEIASLIKNKYNMEPMAHLTCIDAKKYEIKKILQEFKNEHIENILALRGDGNKDTKWRSNDFKYASELIQFIKKTYDFNVSGACYPEGHIDCENLDKDIENLKRKQEAGSSHFISQLFLDNEFFYSFMDKTILKGITVPIQAGIMPVINKKQAERITTLCGSKIPKKFIKIMDKYEYDSIALRDAGIAYAVEQIVDIISSGVKGIHLYSMNNSYVAKSINKSIESIIKSVNK
ncbi:MAG: methylenetetrahydrofolate reductase [NAD(P)H] [Clostridium sp.]|nr:methylenetetrahydrofolate reductase [NAD(P)H] [Clostridium sp.]